MNKARNELTRLMLFHILNSHHSTKAYGMTPQMHRDAKKCINSGTSSYKHLVSALEHFDINKDFQAQRTLHESVLKHAGNILNSKIKISGISRKMVLESESAKNPIRGFSRNPFRPIPAQDIDCIALAVVCYLARGFARFFRLPKNHRTFNVAKVSLNDFHQAYQLSWRLYHSLSVNHHQPGHQNFNKYFSHVIDMSDDEIGKGQEHSINYAVPGKSPYFIWNTLLLCEIFRGNIYRQIDYVEEADRCYRHAQDRFIQLCGFSRKNNMDIAHFRRAKWFLTRTYIRALYERSKARFDRGHILESLITQVRCIEFLIRLYQSESGEDCDDSSGILAKIERIVGFVEAERGLPIFDRHQILNGFGYAAGKKGKKLAIAFPKDFARVCCCIPADMSSFAAQVMARIGFTLYTLRPKADIYRNDRNKWMNGFFRYDKIINNYLAKNSKGKVAPSSMARPSHLGCYCETFFGGGDSNIIAFSDEIERKFSLMLRQHLWPEGGVDIRKDSGDSGSINDSLFYRNILKRTTENIGNIVTIPRCNQKILMREGYKHRRLEGDLKTQHSKIQNLNKFVVLRRWQSFNPKIPRPSGRQLPGGGYFLLWQGKGIVIDPGFDFIQNFYDEGFSLEDIDAIIITHSHPDHDDDFANLTTLIKEWNEYHYNIGRRDMVKRFDIFLNDSTRRKFSSWLQASDVKLGRVIPLPVVCWNKDSRRSSKGPVRGKNVIIDLRQHEKRENPNQSLYNLKIEIVPAWHNDVIGKTIAVGLKFHLFEKPEDKKPVGIIGYTGDTGAYGLDITGNSTNTNGIGIEDQYRDCHLLIAHLGDIRLRELASVMNTRDPESIDINVLFPLIELMDSWLTPPDRGKHELFKDKVREYLRFIISLNLIPTEALKAELPSNTNNPQRVQEWLGAYLADDNKSLSRFGVNPKDLVLVGLLESVASKICRAHEWKEAKNLKKIEASLIEATANKSFHRTVDLQAYKLLSFLTHCSLIPWQYSYHLGIFGIFRLFRNMNQYWKSKRENGKLFIVGELPEELSSYRQKVSHMLNFPKRKSPVHRPNMTVKALTGDIGLHIGLDDPKKPKIRCAYCNYNNELIKEKDSYHSPFKIYEVAIKRHGGAMMYLCRDHYPGHVSNPRYYLSHPYTRII